MANDENWIPIPLQPPRLVEDFRMFNQFFKDEKKITPDPRYLDNARAKSLRPIALNAIENYYKCDDDFDAFIPYLAMNYFDRVISRNELETVHADVKKNDDLFVICCLKDAWWTRTNSTERPFFLGRLQDDYEDMDFFNMEFFICRKLRECGGLRPLTPFTFVEYFISIFNPTDDQLSSTRILVNPTDDQLSSTRKLVHQIIVTSQADIRITILRPSLVAASAVYVASKKLLPKQSSSMLRESLLRTKYVTKKELSNCKKILKPICKAKVKSSKSSSAKEDVRAETSSLRLEGTDQLVGATSSSQPKPDETGDAQLGPPTGKETEGGAYSSGVQGAGQVARASSSSLQEPSTPGTKIDEKGKSICIGTGAPGSTELSTPTQSVSKTVPEATIPRGGTTTEEEEGKSSMEEIQQDPTAGEKAKGESPMEEIEQDQTSGEEIQQDQTPSQAPAGTDDLKLDFELGWSKYDELVRAPSTPRCLMI